MLIIRPDQEAALLAGAFSRFEEQMLGHMKSYFPVDYALLGEAQARTVIGHGVECAEAHGFSNEGEFCQFIDLTLAFGSRFDRDPLLPWAREALGPQHEFDVEARLIRLREGAFAYLEQVMGDEGQHYIRAMLRARKLVFDDLSSAEADAELATRTWLAGLYPEKFRQTDAASLEAFLRLASERAELYGLGQERAGQTLLALAMFMLGSHFSEDPLYPWASSILEDEALSDPELKGRALLDRAKAHLEQALQLIRTRREA